MKLSLQLEVVGFVDKNQPEKVATGGASELLKHTSLDS